MLLPDVFLHNTKGVLLSGGIPIKTQAHKPDWCRVKTEVVVKLSERWLHTLVLCGMFWVNITEINQRSFFVMLRIPDIRSNSPNTNYHYAKSEMMQTQNRPSC